MATEGEKKWEVKVSAKLTGCSADQIWPLLEDFFNLHKWSPVSETCYGVEGTSGELGCVRYCSSAAGIGGGSEEETVTQWAREKLVAIDRIGRCLSYEMLDNNVGFNSYVATMKVLPLEISEGEGCELVWSVVVNPVEGWKLEDFIGFYDSTLRASAERMKELALGGAAKQN